MFRNNIVSILCIITSIALLFAVNQNDAALTKTLIYTLAPLTIIISTMNIARSVKRK